MNVKKISIASIIGLSAVALGLTGAYWYFNQSSTQKLSVIENNSSVNERSKEEEIPQEIKITPDASGVSDGNNNQINTVNKEDTDKQTEDKKVSDSDIKIISNLVSWGHAPMNSRNIDTIIIHSSYDSIGKDPYSVSGITNEYKQYNVAPHYLIDRDGKIYQLVKDSDVAYHAGVSKMPDGRANVNDFSIGIELMNTKTDHYTEAQYDSVKEIVSYLKSKYVIKNLLGHNMVAQGRKDDPWNFEWKKIQ